MAVARWLAAIPAAVLLAFTAAAAHAAGASVPTPYRDCATCPEMVRIAPGSFIMGTDVPLGPAGPASPSQQNSFGNARMRNGPTHKVTISRGFSLGRYEITRGEFAEFVADSRYVPGADCDGLDDLGEYTRKGSGWDNPGFAQTDREPVVCISWNDAQAYVAWLSKRTGRRYRLPTDAEWEYAERAGGPNTKYWWGDSIDDSCAYANLSDLDQHFQTWKGADCHDGHVATAPVGSFKPNAFGLYDMTGNAWEFLADCAHDGYTADAPTDGSAWVSGACAKDVHGQPLTLRRGGSFDHGAAEIGSATVRLAQEVTVRKGNSGFRIARDD